MKKTNKGKCAVCGKSFDAKPGKKYCSKQCARAVENRLRKERRAKATKKIAKPVAKKVVAKKPVKKVDTKKPTVKKYDHVVKPGETIKFDGFNPSKIIRFGVLVIASGLAKLSEKK